MGMVLPELFAKNSTALSAILSKTMNKHKNLIIWREKPSILEFGFADGYSSKTNLAPLIPQDYHEFIGSDISPGMVEYARKNVKMPRSTFLQLDIATTNLPDKFCNRFDNIFSFMSIHMVLDPRQAFKNIFNMLKQGGQTFNIFFSRMPSDPVFHRLNQHPKWGKYSQDKMLSSYYNKNDPKKCYEEDLKAAGFHRYTFEVDENLTYKFENEKQIKDLTLSVNKSIAYVPEEELEEYKKYYIQEIYDHCLMHTVDNQLVVPHTLQYTLFTICAQK